MSFPEGFADPLPTFLYGTGSFALSVLEVFDRRGVPFRGFLDHAAGRPAVRGFPVVSPDVVPVSERTGVAVVVAIHNRAADVAAIVARLRRLGFGRVLTPIDLYDHFAAELGVRYWLGPRTSSDGHEEAITEVGGLFADEPSKTLFEAILRFRRGGDYAALPEPDLVRPYFPADLPPWRIPLRFMDCGAFDGDTLRSILALGIPIEAVAAYEPEETSFRGLVETVRYHRIPGASLWPCGVDSRTVRRFFDASLGEGSSFSDQGSALVQCVSLDESAPGFAPTLIKMDVEGAEPDALRGAEQTIAEHRPGLAISVYHAPTHLWEIPLQIARFARERRLAYSWHLRAHGRNGFDTVFYAVPA